MTSGTDFEIQLTMPHRIRFTSGAFAQGNECVWKTLVTNGSAKVLVFIEEAVAAVFPELEKQVEHAVESQAGYHFSGSICLEGAEASKRNLKVVQTAWDEMERRGIDRHSYVFCIGGGAFLDAVGFAAATCHRGLRFVRFPTTTLSQDDSGVGVKNGINAYGKKNFLGSFSVPYAVINDFDFLHTQPDFVRRAGLIEAVKVALVKDAAFFDWIEEHVAALRDCQPAQLEEAVERSALLHAEHIARGGDPFEHGSSRPLDYGHWSAHKLEQLTDFALSHAEAVAIGVALDTIYAREQGMLDGDACERVLGVIEGLQLPLWDTSFDARDAMGERRVFAGLDEFREHLGGELTVLLLADIGKGVDVHEMDTAVLEVAIAELCDRANVGAAG